MLIVSIHVFGIWQVMCSKRLGQIVTAGDTFCGMLVRLSLPGPGTYKAEEGLDNTSRHPIAPAFSLAAPWQPPRPTSARPGPGAYRSIS